MQHHTIKHMIYICKVKDAKKKKKRAIITEFVETVLFLYQYENLSLILHASFFNFSNVIKLFREIKYIVENCYAKSSYQVI